MKKTIIGFICLALIYTFGVYILPRTPVATLLKNSVTWLDNGFISQTFFLVSSLIIMAILGKGTFSGFGFKTVRLKPFARSVLVSILIAVAMFIAFIFAMSILAGAGGGPGKSEGNGPAMSGFLQTILFVWIYASLCEEILYRGLFLRMIDGLAQKSIRLGNVKIAVSVLISGLLFGLGHLCLLPIMPLPMVVFIIINASVLGIIAGYYRAATGSIIPAIATHMIFNIIGTICPMLLAGLAK